ncbi:MAG: isopenicillin N synthase-like dioxygenase [Gammaproteobacteria bacterium]|jgi:isopenicillin N synthase-like dioxygenase
MQFDPEAKEKSLQQESANWETREVHPANPGDIPIIDVSDWFSTNSDAALETLADQLRTACLQVGFYTLTGHGFPIKTLDDAFNEAVRFHDLPESSKNKLLMDQPDWPGGIGYLPTRHRKLPARLKGNLNTSIIFKRDHQVTLDENHWPQESEIVGFRSNIESYIEAIESLAIRLLPVYARALNQPQEFFNEAFTQPLYRLRLSRYPVVSDQVDDEFGIAPHVDTTFFTILAQRSPGLAIFSERRQCWVAVPVVSNAFIVNSGELLKQWTNDQFLSVKHFANNNTGNNARYSIPFFFNANADTQMECIPSCCSPENPPRYPPISYLESQAVVQGE